MSLDNTLLENKVAIVAGGGRGIGAMTSKTLAASGAATIVVDIEADRAEATVGEIRANGGTAEAIVADLFDTKQVETLVQTTVDTFGRVDILANVAGGAFAYVEFRRMAEWSEDEFDLIQTRNLRYIFVICKAVIKQMLAQGTGGSIVNVASISGVVSAPNHAPYGAAKAGLIQLTKTIALEYGREGIRCNAVSPGSIYTPATSEGRDRNLSRYRKIVPIGRVGQPEDIAGAILFFASPLSSYVTGQMLLVDGGASVNWPLSNPDSPTGAR